MKLTHKTESNITITELKEAILSGRGAEIITPGDELEIELTNGETAAVTFAGFIGQERGRFIFRDFLGDDHVMNNTPTNEGGYFKSEGRRHVLEDLLPLLPPELVEAIEPRNIAELIDRELVEYKDALWLPSATDVFGGQYAGRYYKDEGHDEQLPIFATERGRVKEKDGETWFWWLRSPYSSSATTFVFVNTGGSVNGSFASASFGFAPGFDL
jgi:hypothetical protein